MTKRFIVESVMIDCLCEDEPRIAKVITDTDENYSYEDLYEVAELLNEQQATITELKSIIIFVSDEGDLIVLLVLGFINLFLLLGLGNEILDIRDYIFFKEVLDSESDLRDN